jgi:hypothetical protein
MPNKPVTNNPVEFWLAHNTKYSNLSALTLDIIYKPASEAFAKTVLSICGYTTSGKVPDTNKSNRIAKTLQHRVFLKVNDYLSA